MALRPFNREQSWLLPPSLEDLIPRDHRVRFVAAFLEQMSRADWLELGIELAGEELGAPAYHAMVLLSVWVYGFMMGVRSSRKLEAACREQLPYMWLTGCQYPDHNTLWRFYKEHRKAMKKLFKRTVKTAVQAGLVELALQALDGTKVAGNAAKDRTLDAKGLARVLEGVERAIAELEAQNKAESERAPAKLPAQLAKAEALRERVRVALEVVKGQEGPKEINLTDPEARLVKGRQGIVAGYNAQAVVSRLDPEVAGGTGRVITAAEVVNDPDDHAQLVPMLKEAEATVGQRAEESVADGGYHSGENLRACEAEGYKVLMPEAQAKEVEKPYHKDRFGYDAEKDVYTCPQGQELKYRGTKRRKDRPEARVYRGKASVCRGCAAFGECTKQRQGREIEIGPYEEELRRHRAEMATPEAKASYSQRQGTIEPVFGNMKESQGARRFLSRGLEKARAEWALLAATFNLRTLWGVWRRMREGNRRALLGPTTP